MMSPPASCFALPPPAAAERARLHPLHPARGAGTSRPGRPVRWVARPRRRRAAPPSREEPRGACRPIEGAEAPRARAATTTATATAWPRWRASRRASRSSSHRADGRLMQIRGQSSPDELRSRWLARWPMPRCRWRARWCAASCAANAPAGGGGGAGKPSRRCCCRHATDAGVHPDDLPLVAQGAPRSSNARRRLVADAAVDRPRRLPGRIRHRHHRRRASSHRWRRRGAGPKTGKRQRLGAHAMTRCCSKRRAAATRRTGAQLPRRPEELRRRAGAARDGGPLVRVAAGAGQPASACRWARCAEVRMEGIGRCGRGGRLQRRPGVPMPTGDVHGLASGAGALRPRRWCRSSARLRHPGGARRTGRCTCRWATGCSAACGRRHGHPMDPPGRSARATNR